jgi:TPR repeat protein
MKHTLAATLILILGSQFAWADAGKEDSESSLFTCSVADLRTGSGAKQKQAVSCFQQAADAKDQFAQMVLSRAYWNGQGVPENRVEGYKWLYIAVGRDAESAGMLKDYEWQLTAEEVAEGRLAARSWFAAHWK